MTEQFVAGIIGAPYALNGFVKVKPFSGETEHLLKLKSVTIRQDGKERLLNIEESSAISGTRNAGSTLVMRFAGYDSPEAVKALHGAELLVDRKNAAPLQLDEFYVEDLKGLAVRAAVNINNEANGNNDGEEGEILGHITAIIEGGGGDLAEIRLNNGQTRLVPFRKEFFTDIKPEKGRILLKNIWVLE